MTKEPADELAKIKLDITNLGISEAVLFTKMESAFDNYKQLGYKVEDALAEQNEKIKAIEKKLDILAKAIRNLIKKQNNNKEQ